MKRIFSARKEWRRRWRSFLDRANRYLEFWLTNPHNVERNHLLRALHKKDGDRF